LQVGYTTPVTIRINTLTWSLGLSLLLHGILLLLWPNAANRLPKAAPISVSLLEPRERRAEPREPLPAHEARQPRARRITRMPREAPTRPTRAPAIIAQKSSPTLENKPIGPSERRREPEEKPEKAPSREPPPTEVVSAERQLPTLKELLPPVTWTGSSGRGSGSSGPVSLNTRDPQYVTYFGSIKRSIELVWQYPDLALKYGLQGKLLLQFTILNNGELENAFVVRSSGSHLLDDEAIRAVRAAAPFQPIPPWIGKNRVEVVASFEYLDNRLNYRFVP